MKIIKRTKSFHAEVEHADSLLRFTEKSMQKIEGLGEDEVLFFNPAKKEFVVYNLRSPIANQNTNLFRKHIVDIISNAEV